MRVSVHAAQARLAELLDAVLAGEEVIIAEGARPIAKLVPFQKPKFKIGILEGQNLGEGPDWFEPMSEEDLHLWEGGDEVNR